MSIDVVGAQEVMVHFNRIGPRARAALTDAIGVLVLKLQRHIAQDKLSGQVLGVKTGTLRRSVLDSGLVIQDPAGVHGSVKTNVKYGLAWEFGFDRRVGAGARGGPRTLLGKAKERYMLKHPPGIKHYPERSFMRSALQDMRGEIVADMTQAVRNAL